MDRLLTRCIDGLAALGMFALIVLVLSQVILRSGFSASIPWAEEVGAYLMIWAGMLGTASHLQHDHFMALSLLQSDRRPKLRSAMLVIAASATIAFLAVMFYTGFQMSFNTGMETLSPAARIPMALIYGIFPVGAALIALGYVKGVVHEARRCAGTAGPEGTC